MDCDNTSYTGANCSVLCTDIYSNCKNCHRNNSCTLCIDRELFGNACNESCENCPGEDGLCNIDGICDNQDLDCDDTNYTGANCSVLCSSIHDNCKECHRNNICTLCINRTFFGETCEDSCENCPGNGLCNISGICDNQTLDCDDTNYTGANCWKLCSDVHENCKECHRNNTCTLCINREFFGEICNDSCKNCPGLCYHDGTCENQNENCDDDTFTGIKCDELCSKNFSNCLTCDRKNICSKCINRTKYGPDCNISCGFCPGNQMCDINGICDNQAELCTDDHYTGENCSVLCSNVSNCSRCDREQHCLECINKEFYGPNCNDSCANCPGNGTCNITGICYNKDEDCKDTNYTGANCWELCSDVHENCKECHRNNTCTLCINREFFGNACNESCANCPGNGLCNISGICDNQDMDCDDTNYTGANCWKLCSDVHENCKECHRNNTCTLCINREYFGETCEESCANCPGEDGLCDVNGICDDQDNDCDNISYTGANCSVLCSDVHENCKECHRNNTCTLCINREFFGEICNKSCANCPGKDGLCDINGICDDNKTLCDDDTLTGANCNEPCKDLYPNGYCQRCNREGKCTECSNKRFHGDNCSLGCEDCSDTGCNIQGYCHEFKCKNSTFGLGCEHPCTCESNSDDTDCGKFGGQCLSCKFGYYGKTCQDRCYYKCQTELCCIFKKYSDEEIKTKLEITTNYKYIEIDINGILGKFEIDYNYGYPLTIFNTTTEFDSNCNENTIHKISFNQPRKRDSYEQYFTNYFVNSSIFNGQVIKIQNQIIEGVDITVANNVKCYKNEDKNQISGIIGLGFFNSISNSYFSNKNLEIYELNILSYFLEGNNVQLYFGNMFKEQIDYVERLTSCDVILDSESDIQGKKMTCKLDGIKNAKYTEAFELKDAFITFSLGEKSSLILGNNPNYENYLEKIYFKEDEYQIKYEDRNGTRIKYYSYDSETINKLPNFGFVFNKFYYTYSPDKFFKDESGGRKRFLIEINKNSSTTEFIIGKEFLEDIKFTINNEEAKIYFYAKNAEYSDKFTSEVNDNTFVLNLDAKESAAVSLSIIIFINLLVFSIFYCVKRRKMMNSGDYSRLE